MIGRATSGKSNVCSACDLLVLTAELIDDTNLSEKVGCCCETGWFGERIKLKKRRWLEGADDATSIQAEALYLAAADLRDGCQMTNGLQSVRRYEDSIRTQSLSSLVRQKKGNVREDRELARRELFAALVSRWAADEHAERR